MAKPIFIFQTNMNPEYVGDLRKALAEKMDDYHVLVKHDATLDKDVFECLNDCKGLKDVDIEKLIKEFNNGKK